VRLQTQWLSGVSGVITLTAALLTIPATKSFAQASLFDPTFKVGSGANGPVYSVVVQDDGKIIVGGEFTQISGQPRSNLARLNSDGTLDETFPQGTEGAVYRLLKQTDGRVLVAGAFTELQGASRRGIGRILANGIIDPEFNAGSVLGDYDGFFFLAVQPDDKVLVATLASFANSSQISTLFRLQANGQPDASFIQTNTFSPNQPWVIMPLTNGSILLGGGFQSVNGIPSPGLVLLSANGERDFSFNSPCSTNSGTHSGVYSIVALPEGFLICGKFWKQGSSNRLTVAKLNSTLTWDATFQADSFDPQDYPALGTVLSALRQPDGKFVLGGPFQEVGGYWRRGVVRLDPSGRVDPCFDPGKGLSSTTLTAQITSLALHGNGQVMVAGNFINLMASSHNLTRLLPQSECNAIRVHFRGNGNSAFAHVAGTCTPGGTNHLEWSTNFVDWETAMSSTSPYVYSDVSSESVPALFFRVRKEY